MTGIDHFRAEPDEEHQAHIEQVLAPSWWERNNDKVYKGIVAVGCLIVAWVLYLIFTAPRQPPATPAQTVESRSILDPHELSAANYEALKGALEALADRLNAHGDAIGRNADAIKKVDVRVKAIETAPKFDYQKYRDELKRDVDKLIDDKLKKFEVPMSLLKDRLNSATVDLAAAKAAGERLVAENKGLATANTNFPPSSAG